MMPIEKALDGIINKLKCNSTMDPPDTSDDITLTNKLGTGEMIDNPTNTRDHDKEELERRRK
jgi:hypothetical protein